MIGEDIHRRAFRDTRSLYGGGDPQLFSEHLLRFARDFAGPAVLDLGCATGNYMEQLRRIGKACIGADVNPRYVEAAVSRGLDACVVGQELPFRDRSFDSVLLFEVAEHLADVRPVLLEAARVARRNILLTVPNCAGLDGMRNAGAVYEHFLERDHRNFFTPESMRDLLGGIFQDFQLTEGDPIRPTDFAAGKVAQLLLKAAAKLGFLRPKYFSRLYVVVSLENGR
jgi:SAM-dependent methyltransferase